MEAYNEVFAKGIKALTSNSTRVVTNKYPSIPDWVTISSHKAELISEVRDWLGSIGVNSNEIDGGIKIEGKSETEKLYDGLIKKRDEISTELSGTVGDLKTRRLAEGIDQAVWNIFGPWLEKVLERSKGGGYSAIIDRQASSPDSVKDAIQNALSAGLMDVSLAAKMAQTLSEIKLAMEHGKGGR